MFVFIFPEHFIRKYPGRKIRVPREGLGSHLLKCQRPNIQTSGSGCQKPPECQPGAAAPLGAGGKHKTTMPAVHIFVFVFFFFLANKHVFFSFRVHLTLCQHPSCIRGERTFTVIAPEDSVPPGTYSFAASSVFFVHILTVFVSFSSSRTSKARDLTFFADKAMAVNRQLAEQDGMEDQQQQEVPFVVTATGSSMRLSPPSNSKLARRRQRSSQPKGGPVSAAELRQLLAPLVIVGDCA